jgi:hypothetical protein
VADLYGRRIGDDAVHRATWRLARATSCSPAAALEHVRWALADEGEWAGQAEEAAPPVAVDDPAYVSAVRALAVGLPWWPEPPSWWRWYIDSGGRPLPEDPVTDLDVLLSLAAFELHRYGALEVLQWRLRPRPLVERPRPRGCRDLRGWLCWLAWPVATAAVYGALGAAARGHTRRRAPVPDRLELPF